MRSPQPNLLDKFQQYLANNPDLTENASKTYWSDLAVVVRAVFEAYDNTTLQALVEQSGYKGNYRAAMNHIRKVAEQTQKSSSTPKTSMFTLTDRYNTTLTITVTSEGGLDLKIEGGGFNRNQTALNAQESQKFLAGLKGGEYNLSLALPEGGLEFLTVMGYANPDNDGQDYQLLIGSSSGGQLKLGSFFAESLDEIIEGVSELLEDD